MPMEMDHGLAQTQEVEALQAIYGADFKSVPGVWNCPAFAIKVCSLIERVNAWVTLTVKVRGMRACSRRYDCLEISQTTHLMPVSPPILSS